jgi:cellobiose-specific phosphotransferase system component IIA
MKIVKTKTEKSWIKPGVALTQSEFVEAIKKAENGKFFTVQESMQHFEQWMQSRPKK